MTSARPNNRYLADGLGREEFAGARELSSLHDSGSGLTVQHPADFVEEEGVRRNVKLQDLAGSVIRSRTSVRRRWGLCQALQEISMS